MSDYSPTIEYLAAAFALRIRANGQGGNFLSDDVIQIIQDAHGIIIPKKIAIEVLGFLVNNNFGFKLEDYFAPTFYVFNNEKVAAAFEARASVGGTPFTKAKIIGKPFIDQVLSNPKFIESFLEIESVEEFSSIAPASDRIVRIDHNSRSFEITANGLEEISKDLEKSNEIGGLLGNYKEILLSEIRALQELFKSSYVRATAIFALAIPPLKFLAKEFSASSIGELAKKLIEEIFKMVTL